MEHKGQEATLKAKKSAGNKGIAVSDSIVSARPLRSHLAVPGNPNRDAPKYSSDTNRGIEEHSSKVEKSSEGEHSKKNPDNFLEEYSDNAIMALKAKGRPFLTYGLLAGVFIIIASIRLYFAFSSPSFSDSESYFTLRQIENIVETGFPAFNDPLSYGGRYHIFLPLFHYLIAFFSLFMPVITACKLIPNIAASTAVFAVFLIVNYMTKNWKVALFSALTSAFVPVYISETVNSISVYSFTIPITLFLMYFFLRINIKKNPTYFIALLLFLVMLDFSSYTLIIAIILYLILSWTEGLKVGKAEVELSFFSIFMMALLYISMFSDAFRMHGYRFIWENIPSSLLAQYFSEVNITHAIYMIGFIPAVFGTVAILIHLFRKKKSVYLPMSFSIIISVLLALKLIPLNLGLMLLGLIFAVLFGDALSLIVNYFNKTKLKKWWPFYIPFLLVFIASSIVPSITYSSASLQGSLSQDEIASFEIVKNITDEGVLVVGPVDDGNLIAYYSGRKNMIDTNFFMADDAEDRLSDLNLIYTSAISSKPIEIMDRYNAGYIILNKNAMETYNISKLTYADDYCFPVIFHGKDMAVYEKKCTLS